MGVGRCGIGSCEQVWVGVSVGDCEQVGAGMRECGQVWVWVAVMSGRSVCVAMKAEKPSQGGGVSKPQLEPCGLAAQGIFFFLICLFSVAFEVGCFPD